MATPLVAVEHITEPQDERTALTKEAFQRDFFNNLFYILGKFPTLATKNPAATFLLP